MNVFFERAAVAMSRIVGRLYFKTLFEWCIEFVEKYYLCAKKHMKHYHIIRSPFCTGDDLVKNGHNPAGTQR